MVYRMLICEVVHGFELPCPIYTRFPDGPIKSVCSCWVLHGPPRAVL